MINSWNSVTKEISPSANTTSLLERMPKTFQQLIIAKTRDLRTIALDLLHHLRCPKNFVPKLQLCDSVLAAEPIGATAAAS